MHRQEDRFGRVPDPARSAYLNRRRRADINFLVIGALVAALVLAFVAYAYREFGADNKALDEVAKRTHLQRAARLGAHVQVPEELSQLLTSVDLGKSRPTAHVYGLLERSDRQGSQYLFRYVWNSQSTRIGSTAHTVACFIHEDPIGFEAQWSAELRDAGGMVPSAVVDELDQVSRIYDNLALEIRGKAVLVSTSVALPIAEWPGFYNQARRIDNSLSGRRAIGT